jgi:hypothetical protein
MLTYDVELAIKIDTEISQILSSAFNLMGKSRTVTSSLASPSACTVNSLAALVAVSTIDENKLILLEEKVVPSLFPLLGLHLGKHGELESLRLITKNASALLTNISALKVRDYLFFFFFFKKNFFF